jgi:ABC-type nitrate/sulfonate/bicarbonate transport system permease component
LNLAALDSALAKLKVIAMTSSAYYDFVGIAVNSLFSLERVLIGVILAATVGIVMGVLRSALPQNIKRNLLLRFLLEAPKFPPPIAWIPFVILAFGIGEFSAISIVFIGAFAPIFTAAYDGAESIPLVWRQTAASLQLSTRKFLYAVVFKGSLPQIFVGLRSGVSVGWMAVVAAEMISGQSGLGYSIQLNRQNLQYDLMCIDMLMIGLIGFLLFELIIRLEKICIPWHERTNRQ